MKSSCSGVQRFVSKTLTKDRKQRDHQHKKVFDGGDTDLHFLSMRSALVSTLKGLFLSLYALRFRIDLIPLHDFIRTMSNHLFLLPFDTVDS